jgi:hypothetical protein
VCLQAAFSLVEIMVVMGLLTVIILGLLLMFNQTQRAFRTGMTQVDVLENGRTITEMLARELSQMTPQGYARTSNTLNFYVVLPNYAPLLQPLPGGSGERRTNLLEELFFTRRENRDNADGWTGTGYFVRTNDGSGNLGFPGLVGSLYRFEMFTNDFLVQQSPRMIFDAYRSSRTIEGRASRVMDGVIHFKIKAYDTNGVWQTDNLTNNYNPATTFNFIKTDIRQSTTVAPGEVGQYFYYSNAVPAFVEFELGILEGRVMERAKSIPDLVARRQYLEDQAARVHLFRMRVPVRNVDPTAYP